MYVPDAINGSTLKTEFPPNPRSKSCLVIRTQERKGITENQGHSGKSKQEQKETNEINQFFHFETVMTNCPQSLFDFSQKTLSESWLVTAISFRVSESCQNTRKSQLSSTQCHRPKRATSSRLATLPTRAPRGLYGSDCNQMPRLEEAPICARCGSSESGTGNLELRRYRVEQHRK